MHSINIKVVRGFMYSVNEKRKVIKVAKSFRSIPADALSDKIITRIESIEAEVGGSISDEDFQFIIRDHAEAWVLRRKEDNMFLYQIRFDNDGAGKTVITSWTANLRNAFVFKDQDKTSELSLFICGSPSACEVVPLIYQLEPFYIPDKYSDS